MKKEIQDNQLMLKKDKAQILWETNILIVGRLWVIRVSTWTHQTGAAIKIQARGHTQTMPSDISPKITIMTPMSLWMTST